MEADSRKPSPDEDYEAGLQGYSKEDLISILHSIDREKFPDRYAMAKRRYLEIANDPAFGQSGLEDRFNTGWRRTFALSLDGAFLSIVGFFILYPLFKIGYLRQFEADDLNIFLSPIYGVVAIWKFGKTLGKRICGVEVVTWPEEGKAGLREAVLREAVPLALMLFALVIWALPEASGDGMLTFISFTVSFAVGIGALAWILMEIGTMLFDPQRRALHDKIAGTVVIKRRL